MCWCGTSPNLPLMIEICYVFPIVPLRITPGRSTCLPYQRMKEPINLNPRDLKHVYSNNRNIYNKYNQIFIKFIERIILWLLVSQEHKPYSFLNLWKSDKKKQLKNIPVKKPQTKMNFVDIAYCFHQNRKDLDISQSWCVGNMWYPIMFG